MWNFLLSLFFQENCPLCQRTATQVFCLDCQQQLAQCQFDQKQRFWRDELPLFVWGKYEQTLKRAISALKYNNKAQIGEIMGNWLGKAWNQAKLAQKYPKLTVIPIPMHPEKIKQRGFNQAELIAKGFCQFTGYNFKKKGLIRVKKTEALFGLNPEQRQQELTEAFQITKDLLREEKEIPILLIDDIYTTGTTAREAKNVLEKAGFFVLGIAAVSTPKK